MDDISTEVRRYLRYLRRYWLVLIGGAVVGALAIVAANELRSSSPTATTSSQEIAILSERWVGMSNASQPGTMFAEDPDELAVAVAAASSDASMAQLEAELGLAPSRISFQLDGRRVLITIGAEPDVARDVGDWLRERIDKARIDGTLRPVDLAVRALEARLASLPQTAGSPEDAAAVEAARVGTELEMLRAAAGAIPDGLSSEIVRQSSVGTGSVVSSDSSLVQLSVGLVGGFVLAAAAVIVWSVLDRRIATRRDLEAVLGPGSLLAVLPSPPNDGDLRAAAAAINHVRSGAAVISLVPFGPDAHEVASRLGMLSETSCTPVDVALADVSDSAYIPVARANGVTSAELERLRFVVERAGGNVPGMILVSRGSPRAVLD